MTVKERHETLVPTPIEGVYLGRRDGGGWHVVENVGTPFLLDRVCDAGQHDRVCWAVERAAAESKRLITEGQEAMSNAETTAIAVSKQRAASVQRVNDMQLQVSGHMAMWNDLVKLGEQHIATGFAPTGVKSAQAGALIILKAMELQIPITAAYEFIDIIEGRPRLRGQMIGALVERSGKGFIHIAFTDPIRCVAVGRRPGKPDVKIEVRIDQFKNLNQKDNWKNYPADMLRWKAIARVGRVMFPDVLGGMDVGTGAGESYEVVDTSDEPIGMIDVTPTEVADPTIISTGSTAGGSGTSEGPAFWKPMCAKMADKGVEPGDVCAAISGAFTPEAVNAYCRSKGVSPSQLIDRIASLTNANIPFGEKPVDAPPTDPDDLPFDADPVQPSMLPSEWEALQEWMKESGATPMQVSGAYGGPWSQEDFEQSGKRLADIKVAIEGAKGS